MIASSPVVSTGQVVYVFPANAAEPLGPGDLAVVQDGIEVTMVTSSPERIEAARADGRGIEGPFAVIRLEISLSFGAPGFLARATSACAEVGVNVFVLSTYSFDYVLVPESDRKKAIDALTRAGFSPRKGIQPMTLGPEEIAQAFSGHRFADAYPYLAEDVHWTLVGGPMITGKQAVIDTCEQTLRELAETTTQFAKFKTIVGPDAVVIDATGTYDGPDGSRSTMGFCDIFDFVDSSIVEITSYTIELPAD